jgi:hypothetical protein
VKLSHEGESAMTFLTVDVADQDMLDAHGVSESLNEMFTVAILLTGNADRAECAVLEGIETLDRGPAPAGAVFQATIRAAITPAMTPDEEEARQDLPGVSWLPIELQRVLLLPKCLRHVFVLRLLLGLPRDQCSQLLQLDDEKLDERVGQSAHFLAQRHSVTGALPMSVSHTC